MSAFLGPIHHWLYNKINIQDRLTDAYLVFAAEAGMNDLREAAAAKYGEMPEGSLENLIDESNIHGWLQSKITLVENRYAFVVTEILKRNPSYMEQLEKLAFEFGKKNSPLTADSTAKTAYQLLNDTLIDGMPCDHVNMLISAEENEVIWERTQCVHAQYWTANGGNTAAYYNLRAQLIKGLLTPAGLSFTEESEGRYVIK